jgi:membrane-bound inhibitor of C-type lysozyme
MSGIVQNNILRSSGLIAVSAAGLNWNSTIITGSTATVEAGNGYWINTTSNTCTITLPSSAEQGDQIILIDYLRTWGTNKIIIDSNGLNYQGEDDTYTVEYTTDGQSINIIYSGSTKGWLPLEDDVVALEPAAPPTQRAIVAFGQSGSGIVSISNLINSSGVVATDVTGVGQVRTLLGAATYGGDKAIFAYGNNDSSTYYSMSNLVNNSGVVAADVTGVGTARQSVAAASYGGDKAIFGYGKSSGGSQSMTNLVNNSGTVAADVTGVGTARLGLAATNYGTDKVIFGYGFSGGYLSMTNLASNTGVVSADVTGVGTALTELSAAKYGSSGQALFCYGENASASFKNTRNLISNTGVVASTVSGAGTARRLAASSSYGGDKAIVAFGYPGSHVSLSNLISNSGVIASDTTGVGTARRGAAGAGFSSSA